MAKKKIKNTSKRAGFEIGFASYDGNTIPTFKSLKGRDGGATGNHGTIDEFDVKEMFAIKIKIGERFSLNTKGTISLTHVHIEANHPSYPNEVLSIYSVHSSSVKALADGDIEVDNPDDPKPLH